MRKIVSLMIMLSAFGGILAARPAAAAYLTGADLYAACNSKESKDVLTCMGYVAGVIDYHVMMQSMGSEPTATDFCLPADLSMEKAAVRVMLYLKRNPQNGSFIAAPAVLMALSQSYPCGPMKTVHKKKKRR